MNPKEMNYIEELTKTIKALSLTIETIESDLKKVKNTLTTLSTLKDNIGDIDAIIQTNRQELGTRPMETSDENRVE